MSSRITDRNFQEDAGVQERDENERKSDMETVS